MPNYKYKARNSLGKIVTGTLDAVSREIAISNLETKGYFVVEIEEKSIKGILASIDAKLQKGSKTRGRVKMQEVAIFSRQLSTLVNAGVNLLDAVSDVAQMVSNPYFLNVLTKVSDDIKGGKTLSEALSEYKKIFDNAFISMIAVGEKTGKLAKVLDDLASYLEKSVKLKRKIKSAAAYPVFVGSFFVIVFLGLVLVLIPKFEEMFKSFGAELPLPTRIVMGVSNFMLAQTPLLIGLAIAAYIGFRMFTKTPKGLMMWHKLFFKIPIFAPIYIKMIFARFFQTLSTLIKSGVDIVSSLQIAGNTVSNVHLKSILSDIKDGVVEGELFSNKMDEYNLFPKMIVRMTAVGEKSGQLEQMFDKVTDYYQDEVDVAVATLSSVVEPVLIIFLGFTVGVAVIALYLPIFNMANAMAGQNM